jgi:AbiV family abortive infection protein
LLIDYHLATYSLRMKSIFEEIQEKLVAKNQIERLKQCIDIQYALLELGKSLVSASEIESAYTEYRRVVSHAEALWEDACALYLRERFATALALSITCLEEIGKISVARLRLIFQSAVPRVLQMFPNASTEERRGNPFYSHSQKVLLAAGAGALVNSRLDRILGMPAVIAFLDDVERGKIEPLRQSCLYSDVISGQLHIPSEQVGSEQARFYVVLSGEVLAEVAGLEPSEWARLIAKVQEFEKQIGHPHK